MTALEHTGGIYGPAGPKERDMWKDNLAAPPVWNLCSSTVFTNPSMSLITP